MERHEALLENDRKWVQDQLEFDDQKLGVIDKWIRSIKDVYHMGDGSHEVVTRHDKDDPLDPIYRYYNFDD